MDVSETVVVKKEEKERVYYQLTCKQWIEKQPTIAKKQKPSKNTVKRKYNLRKKKWYKCTLCNIKSKHKHDLKRHVAEIHCGKVRNNRKTVNCKTLQCHLCAI